MEKAQNAADTREERLTNLVKQYQKMLLKMCFVYLRDEEQARDAVQETFLKAYRALDSFRHECSEKNWLIHIAMNTCRSMKRSAWSRFVDRRITPEQLSTPAIVGWEDEMEILCEVMALPDKLKEVLMLYYWQDLNVIEIADALEVAQSTVSHRLKKAREKLHQALERRTACGRTSGQGNRSPSL